MTEIIDVIDTINDILDDNTLQKNIRMKLEKIKNELKNSNPKDIKMTVDKCVNDLDEISNDSNVQTFVRTQVWSIVSMLESLE